MSTKKNKHIKTKLKNGFMVTQLTKKKTNNKQEEIKKDLTNKRKGKIKDKLKVTRLL